jgi:hypothetical protein
MGTIKAIGANRVNQGSSVVGVQRGGETATVVRGSGNYDFPSGKTGFVQYSSASYSAKYDDYGLKRKTLAIGTWDMDATATVSVTHGLTGATWKDTRNIELSIRNDDDNTRYTNNGGHGLGMINNDVVASGITSTSVILCRRESGQFDDTEFNSTAISRGNVTLWYE